MILRKLFLVTLLTAVAACTSSPTGRNQLLFYSTQEMAALGGQSFEQIKEKEKISQDKAVNNYVQCVADAVTRNVPQPKIWEVVVFDSEQVNAFALPGGKIGVYTGLLKVAKTPDQLAAVIGHEIVHVTAQHSNERLSQSQLTSLGMQVTDYALQSNAYRDITMSALGLGVQYGVILPYGRSQESEADLVGLTLMADAGFDPNESIALWRNMATASKGQQPPELLSTHPSHDTRIKDLQKAIAKLPAYSAQTSRPDCGRL